jgi:hypothetical protein
MKVDPSTLNKQFMSKIASGDKQGAMDAATEFTRLTLREEGLLRKVLPPKPISYSDLDKQIDSDHPVKIMDKEVSQPLSVSVPFGSLPANQYIKGARYRVDFARLVSKNYTKDTAELNAYDYDIREVFKDNAIKDHMTGEDVPFFQLVNSLIQSDPDNGIAVGNVASAMTGKVQFHDYTDSTKNPRGYTGFSRDSVVDAFTIMTKGFGSGANSTPIRLQTDLCVMNANTGLEFVKLLPTEIGERIADKLATDGLVEDTFFGRRFLFTIKDDIIEDGAMYMFAKPQFLGVLLELEQPVLFLENRAYMMEFFIYSMLGSSIGNAFGLAKAKYF